MSPASIALACLGLAAAGLLLIRSLGASPSVDRDLPRGCLGLVLFIIGVGGLILTVIVGALL